MKNKQISKIACLGVAILFVSAGVLGYTKVLQSKAKTSRTDWMASLSDSTAVKDVNIPGTHDSMALYGLADLAGQCQSLNIANQLEIGARAFDIRLQYKSGVLQAVHGIVDEKDDFGTVVDACKSFLEEHPTEFIIMSVKKETSNDTLEDFAAKLDEQTNDAIFYRATSLPEKVGDIRGKVVLLSRFANSTFGVPCDEGWEDSTTFDLPSGIHVQDHYKLDTIDEKITDIKACLTATTSLWKLNFFSGYLAGGFPPSYALTTAKGVNAWAKENLSDYSSKGICLFDFIDSELVSAFLGGNV